MSRHEDLDDITQIRIAQIVENSAPNPHRPKLKPEREELIDVAERLKAACYASMEEMKHKIESLIREIKKGPVGDAEK